MTQSKRAMAERAVVRKDMTEYRVWMSMITRCHNPKHRSFRHYGGRGIAVCKRWRDSFPDFYADMGTRPFGMTLDRIDNNKGYEPSNCRWATLSQQRRNSRQSIVMIERNGRTQCIQDWAHELGLLPDTIYTRKARGFPQSEWLRVDRIPDRLSALPRVRARRGKG